MAVNDACVLYLAPLRNLQEDWPDLSPEKLDRVRRLMDAHAEDCLVTGYEGLVGSLSLPNPHERHVLAGYYLEQSA